MRRLLGALMLVLATLLVPGPPAHAADFDLTFVRGKSYGVASNSVLRGERDHYYFGARPGQTITIAITSVEDNAVVELYVKEGGTWVQLDDVEENRVLYGALPESEGNQYRITVGGTRGNATYDLFVGISAAG